MVAAAAADRGATAVRTSLDNMASENADYKCVLPGLPRSAATNNCFCCKWTIGAKGKPASE